jgi:hypothetical protein
MCRPPPCSQFSFFCGCVSHHLYSHSPQPSKSSSLVSVSLTLCIYLRLRASSSLFGLVDCTPDASLVNKLVVRTFQRLPTYPSPLSSFAARHTTHTLILPRTGSRRSSLSSGRVRQNGSHSPSPSASLATLMPVIIPLPSLSRYAMPFCLEMTPRALSPARNAARTYFVFPSPYSLCLSLSAAHLPCASSMGAIPVFFVIVTILNQS